ncbi:MAG TPA: zinc-ribbon domain-containing protein, partial [Polyangiaceae bacterium]|nr:zinc-ribbon domain-containing protein [Polyangiaceae bacterium]
MDVQCERCKTEYEFDDALVSGRGTTVRCTNCGHQFKVRGPELREAGADKWTVQTTGGQRLTFLSLRELQRAILAKQVSRADVLTRGAGPARALGSIAELEPFFDGRTSSRPPPPGMGTAPLRVPLASSVPDGAEAPAFPKRTASWGPAPSTPPLPPPRRKVDTLRPVNAGAPPPPTPPPSPRAPAVETLPLVSATPYAFGQAAMAPPGTEDPVTIRRPAPTPAPPPVQLETSSPLPPPTNPIRPPLPTGDDELPGMRAWQPSSLEESYSLPRRRRVGGWVVAFVLLLAVGVGAWVVARPYLAARQTVAVTRLDPRAQSFVADGEKAMGDGNLELSQESFDKASALAEHDPRVLLDEARVAAAKADVPWLALRLLPPTATDELRTTKAQLADRMPRVKKAAEDASTAAPDDLAALRAKVDALRLVGERDAARSYVPKIGAQASQPETAYVLAALDLAESDPLWTTVIDRLRLAAAGEGNAGRARAALVYALAKSGDVVGAKAELAKLDALTRPYPLLPQLHAFVDRAPAKASVDGGAAASVPHIDVSALPTQAPPPAGAAAGGGAGEEPGAEAPATGGMKAAAQAIKKGD